MTGNTARHMWRSQSCWKRYLASVHLSFLVGLCILVMSTADSRADILSGRYILPPQAVDTQFSVRVLGGQPVKGRFGTVKGEMVLNAQRPESSRVRVTVDLRSVETNNDRVTGFLKSSAMFNVSEFPTAEFESYSVRLIGETTAQVEGFLTMRGTRQRTSLEVELEPAGNRQTIAIEANGGFFRSLYGMDAGLPIYADKVRLQIKGTGKRS
ncbi:MAG: YceI family protein [Labrenzia sp.]|uniref:YceI family protein n=1 Tax=Roseibium alexandrii TaxID=388408 RepID=UPI00375094B5